MADEKKDEHAAPAPPAMPEPFRAAFLASGMREVKCECCKALWLTRGKSDICPPCRKLN